MEYEQKDVTVFYNGNHGVNIIKGVDIRMNNGTDKHIGLSYTRYTYNMVSVDEDYQKRCVTIKYYQVDEPYSTTESVDTQEDNGTLLATEVIPFENIISVNAVRELTVV